MRDFHEHINSRIKDFNEHIKKEYERIGADLGTQYWKELYEVTKKDHQKEKSELEDTIAKLRCELNEKQYTTDPVSFVSMMKDLRHELVKRESIIKKIREMVQYED